MHCFFAGRRTVMLGFADFVEAAFTEGLVGFAGVLKVSECPCELVVVVGRSESEIDPCPAEGFCRIDTEPQVKFSV
jgi:hypothetical protein